MAINRIKVLLVTYACEPNKGSEPAVGFNWSLALSEYFEVTVLTRKNNQNIIEEYLKSNNIKKINFIYFDIPILSTLKNYLPFGVNIYSILWEYFSFLKLRNYKFDVIQRLTFVNLVTLNRFYRYCNNYINGFLGGGECAPASIISNYPLKYKIIEKFRYTINIFFLNTRTIKKTYNSSKFLLAVTEESKSLIAGKFNKKEIFVMPAIFYNGVTKNYEQNFNEFSLIYAGRLIYWKNLDIIINSFSIIKKNGYKIKLSIVGDGPQKKDLQKLSEILQVSDFINFKDSMKQELLFHELKKHSLFVFASSHDSGGMVILEAVAHNLPVVFLDTGGPKEIFKGIDYPLKINPAKSYDEIVNDFSDKIIWAYNNYNDLMMLFRSIREKILERYNLNNKVKELIKLYKEFILESSTNT